MRKQKQINEETDLQFLLRPSRKAGSWSDKKIRAFVRLMRTYWKLPRISKQLKIGVGSLMAMKGELKRAAKQGFTLEKYLKAGRPLKPGNKVLAK